MSTLLHVQPEVGIGNLEFSYHSDPAPHIFLPQLLPPHVYEQMTFPSIPIRARGRSGRDLFVGESGHAEAINSIGFRDLYGLFTSPRFVAWVLSVFEQDMIRYHCRASARDCRLIPFLETREALNSAPESLDDNADPNELFTRFDFTIGGQTYTQYVHLDSPRRIVGGVLFFSDAEKDKINGGEFTLYRDLLFRDDRYPHWPSVAKRFPVKANTGVLFLNCNRAFHGPSEIRSIEGSRRWVYFSISSRNRVWEDRSHNSVRTFTKRAAGRVCRVLGLTPRIAHNPQSKLDANAHED